MKEIKSPKQYKREDRNSGRNFLRQPKKVVIKEKVPITQKLS